MTMLQLNPLIPVETPQGRGMAHLVIDYGPEANLLWTVFLDANGECWTFQNAQVRLQANPTMRPALTDSKPGIADMLPRMVDNSRPNADMRPADVAQRMGERLRTKANQQRAQQEEMLKKQPPEEDKPMFKRPEGAPSTWTFRHECKCEFCESARANNAP